MTTNPNWPEIKESLKEGQKVEDRPDLVARCFQLRLEELLREINKDGILGNVEGFMSVIEFQKRGLPQIDFAKKKKS